MYDHESNISEHFDEERQTKHKASNLFEQEPIPNGIVREIHMCEACGTSFVRNVGSMRKFCYAEDFLHMVFVCADRLGMKPC